MRAPWIAVVAAALLAACGEDDAGGIPQPAVAPFPLTGGVARFVIVPPEDGPSWMPELTYSIVFEGPGPSFGLVWPEDFTRFRSIGPGETTAAGGRAFGYVPRDGRRILEPPPEDVPTLSFVRIELLPLDVDRDGIADRLDGIFTVLPELATGDLIHEGPTFTSRAQAEIVPASLGAPRFSPPWFLGDAAAPGDSIQVRFDLPSPVESARIVTTAGELPVSWSEAPTRRVVFSPAGLLPWSETVRIAGVAQVLGAGAALEPFSVDVPVRAGPAAPWSESFEADDLDGYVVTHGNVTLADADDGLPGLDGDRFLLVDNEYFAFLFEIEVPDTAAPTLRLDARFAYRDAGGRGATPYVELEAAGAGGRSTAQFGDRLEPGIPLDGGVYAAVSATESVELPLAALHGSRAVVSVRGFSTASSDRPAADGKLQLDGLRIVP